MSERVWMRSGSGWRVYTLHARMTACTRDELAVRGREESLKYPTYTLTCFNVFSSQMLGPSAI